MAYLFSCDKMVSFRVIQMVLVKWLSCVFFSFIADIGGVLLTIIFL